MFIDDHIERDMRDCNLFNKTILKRYVNYCRQILKFLDLRKLTLLINNR